MDPARLKAAAGTLGVRLDDTQADRLIRYVALLERWNERFNLISRQDLGRIWPRHILDSLSIAPFLVTKLTCREQASEQYTAVDIGTGAGLPGLPLAIALPELTWRLIDRNRRKVRFLDTVISQIGLQNAAAAALDLGAESADEVPGLADIVVSRAVAEPAGLLPLAAPLLKPTGRLVLMTAAGQPVRLPDGSGFVLTEVRELSIPGLDRTHEVTIIDREWPSAAGRGKRV